MATSVSPSPLGRVLSELPPAIEAMLLTARTVVDGAADRRLRELADNGLAWPEVADAAIAHQVLPLVASTLLADYRPLLADSTARYLEDFSRGITAHNMMLTAELFHILDAFESAGIPAFPYKGPSLAVTAYGGVRFRQFGDLDLLVPKDQYLAAKAVLGSRGFKPLIESTGADDSRLLRHTSAHAFVREGIHIDLQWGSTYRKALSVPVGESLWESTETTYLMGRAVPAIPTNILFVFLCAHGSRHFWDRLKWVCDVAEMARSHPDLDWVGISRTADQAGVRRVMNMAVLLAASLLDAPIPPPVVQTATQDTVAGELAALATRRHFSGEKALLAGGRAQLSFTARSKERPIDRARFVASYFFSPTNEDYEWIDLRGRLGALYPILRPLRMAGRAVRRGLEDMDPHA